MYTESHFTYYTDIFVEELRKRPEASTDEYCHPPEHYLRYLCLILCASTTYGISV